MVKRGLGLFILICMACTGVGCWDARDIERLSFPYAAAYDVHNTSGMVSSNLRETPVVDVTVLNPNLSPKAVDKASIETVSASIISYARDKRAYTNPEVYFPSLNQVLLEGEELARMGLTNYIDSVLRVPNIAVTMNLAVVEGRGEEILKTPSMDYETMGVELRALLRNSERKGFIPSTTLHEFAVNLVTGKNPVIPVIAKKEDSINFTGMAIFKKDRMIAKLDTQETRSLALLRGIRCSGSLPFFMEQDGESLERGVVQLNNSRKIEVTRDGDQYTFIIKVKLSGVLAEHVPTTTLISESHLREIEDTVANDIENDCNHLLEKMQQDLKVDCIDISKYALAKWRKDLQPTIDQNNFIQQAKLQCQVEVNLHNTGELR